MIVSPQRACIITNARENVEQEHPQTPQEVVHGFDYPLNKQVTNEDFRSDFEVL